MTIKCLFYVDSGPLVGLGHLIRTIALGKELKKNNFRIRYLINDNIETIKIIKKQNLLYHTVDFKNLELQKKYLEENTSDIIITDFFNPSPELLLLLKKYCNLLVSVDDYNLSQYCSDVIINPNSFYKKEDYTKSAPKSEILCGSKYYIMDKKFRKFHLNDKKLEKIANNVLVTFGGNDPNNSSLEVIDALSGFKDEKIISSSKIFKKENDMKRKKLLQSKPNVKIYDFIKNMPKIIYDSDVVFCGGGSTLYQSACVGTPIITIPQAEHELRTAIEFERKKIAINLGLGKDVSKDDIKNAFLKIREDKRVRRAMSVNGKKEVDGKGTERVAQLVLDRLNNYEKKRN